jgi:hypothetical protein
MDEARPTPLRRCWGDTQRSVISSRLFQAWYLVAANAKTVPSSRTATSAVAHVDRAASMSSKGSVFVTAGSTGFGEISYPSAVLTIARTVSVLNDVSIRSTASKSPSAHGRTTHPVMVQNDTPGP